MSLLFNQNFLLKNVWPRMLGAIILAFWATTVSAEIKLERLNTLKTRYGTFSIIEEPDGYSKSIAFNGKPLPVEPVQYPSFSGMWSLDGTDHAWVLAALHDGAQGCTTGATVIRVDSDGAKVIGTTWPCEGLLQDVQLSENEIQLKYFTDSLRTEFTWYHFNENEMSETKGTVAFASEQAAGSGHEVTRWIGSHPQKILQEQAERRRFLSIMPEEEIRKLAASIAVANTAKQLGDWVYGRGCRPHLCDVEWGAFGIRISDGRPVSIIHNSDETRHYGEEGNEQLLEWVESEK